MKLSFNTDRLLGISAMLISLVTLIIFLYQTNLMREQSRLSVRPRLAFTKNINKVISVTDSTSQIKVTIDFTVRNNGLGPAIVESSQVVDKGKSYSIMSFFDEVYPEMKKYGTFLQITDINVGEAIPARESISLFTYQYDEEMQGELLKLLGVVKPYTFPFHVTITYASMYEELWEANSDVQGHPKRIK